jgi:hypothetical protein
MPICYLGWLESAAWSCALLSALATLAGHRAPRRSGYSTSRMSAIDGGLIRTMEDPLRVLRNASQPLGPMGAEWLERQARAMQKGGE